MYTICLYTCGYVQLCIWQFLASQRRCLLEGFVKLESLTRKFYRLAIIKSVNFKTFDLLFSNYNLFHDLQEELWLNLNQTTVKIIIIIIIIIIILIIIFIIIIVIIIVMIIISGEKSLFSKYFYEELYLLIVNTRYYTKYKQLNYHDLRIYKIELENKVNGDSLLNVLTFSLQLH